MLSGKRSPLDIFASILLGLAESKLKKTHVTYKANLDSRLASKYLRALLQLEMISKPSEDSSYFIITKKGRHFLEQYCKLIKF